METGLLEVSSPRESGYFYIKNGEIKDGEFGKARGPEAIELVRSIEDASFCFKGLEPAEYARVVWEKNFGGTIPTRRANLPRSHSTLRQPLVHVATAYNSFERGVVSLAGQAQASVAATYGNLESAAGSVAQRAQLRAGATWRNLERAVIWTAHQAQPQAAAAYCNLQKAAASTAGYTHSYVTAAYSYLKRTAALTGGRTLSYTAAASEGIERAQSVGIERAQAVQQRLSFLWQIIGEWKTTGRERLARFRNEVILRGAPRALVLIKKGMTIFPRLFEEPTRTRLGFGIITTSILIAAAVAVFQIIQRRDQAPLTPLDATTSSSNENRKGSKVSGKRSRAPRRTASPRAHKVVASNEETTQQPTRLRASSDKSKKQPSNTPNVLTIPIVLQIENGRVSQASVLKHRAGMEGYEAAALRMVRERHYAGAAKRRETVEVKLNQSPD